MKQYLVDSNGNRVHAKLVKGRFGPAWALLHEDGRYKEVFITNNPGALRRAGGYRVVEEADTVDKPEEEVLIKLPRGAVIEVADVVEVYLKGGWVREPHAKQRLQTALEQLRKVQEV